MAEYGLEKGYLRPDPRTEFSLLCVRIAEIDSHARRIRLMLEDKNPPKVMFYGLYGIGKTHVLHYIIHQLEDRALTLFIDCPIMHRRSTFIALYGEMIGALGRERVMELLRYGLRNSRPLPEPFQRTMLAEEFTGKKTLSEWTGLDPDVARVVERALMRGGEYLLWKYLLGEKLSTKESDTLQTPAPGINNRQAFSILNALALLEDKKEDRWIVFALDEAERIRPLAGDSLGMFKESLRELTDINTRLGILFGGSIRAIEDIPALNDPAVRRRIQPFSFEITQYEMSELKQLVLELLSRRRSPGFNTHGAAEESRKVTKENVLPESYPFTDQAVSAAAALACDSGQKRPHDILTITDRALLIARERASHVIEEQVVKQAAEEVKDVLYG